MSWLIDLDVQEKKGDDDDDAQWSQVRNMSDYLGIILKKLELALCLAFNHDHK